MKKNKNLSRYLGLLSLLGMMSSSHVLAASLDFSALDKSDFRSGTYGSGVHQYYWSSSGDKPILQLNAFDESTQGSRHGLWLEDKGSFTIDFTHPVSNLQLAFPEFEVDEGKQHEHLTLKVTNANGQVLNLNQSKYIAHQGSNVISDGTHEWTAHKDASSAAEKDLHGMIHFDLSSEQVDKIEVEFDTYKASLRLVEPSWTEHLDYGDAPSSYGVAGHILPNNVTHYLGNNKPDTDSASQASADADSDGSDEDGVTLPLLLKGKATNIPVKTNGANGYLQAWVDWNRDGDFADSHEKIASNVKDTDNDGLVNLYVNVPTSATAGDSFARFRWSSQHNLGHTGKANNGEVEDYKVKISTPPAGFSGSCTSDGDIWYNSPTKLYTYNLFTKKETLKTSLAKVYGDIALGKQGKLYGVTYGNSGKTLDEIDPNTGKTLSVLTHLPNTGSNALSVDEFGWLYIGSNSDSKVYRFLPNVSTELELWIDMQKHGQTGSSSGDFIMIDGEAFVAWNTTVTTSNGHTTTATMTSKILKISNLGSNNEITPNSSVTHLGDMPSSTWGLTGNVAGKLYGVASNKALYEIKLSPFAAHKVGDLGDLPYGATSITEQTGTICQSYDYSDAPSSYGTPRHALTNNLRLGHLPPSADSAAKPSVNADAEGAEEDGAIFPALTAGTNISIPVKVSGSGGYLQAWVDWNKDGDFADSYEQVATNAQDSDNNGTININLSVPTGATVGTSYSRLRWSTQSNLNATTEATDGEVEDYKVQLKQPIDSDNDGLLDTKEAELGTNPNNPDTDGDGLKDGAEVNTHQTNPKKADTDGDGLSDGDEINTHQTDPKKADTDSDGLNDGVEVNTHQTDPKKADSDGDGLSDGDEVNTHQTNPKKADTDSDGLNDGAEINTHQTDPNKTDSDSDGLNDGSEVNNHKTNPKKADSDNDGLNDGDEVNTHKTHPNNYDSDEDSISDYAEVIHAKSNPLSMDSDGDGLLDTIEIGSKHNQPKDSDGDQVFDINDIDDDNDTVLTKYELPPSLNTDNDDKYNYLDTDDDNDGKLTKDETPDPNGDGNPADAIDMDSDSIPNYLDADENAFVLLNVKAILQGAYDKQEKLMRDALRLNNFIPINQPYSQQRGTLVYNGTESTTAQVLSSTGNNAIVDWVMVELRDNNDPTQIKAQLAALIQRDGDIVMSDSANPNLRFNPVEAGHYYVALRHRNHLGVMTAQPVYLSTIATTLDFSSIQTEFYGDHAQYQNSTQSMLWTGDSNHDNRLIALGRSNDNGLIVSHILTHPNNKLANLSFVDAGYHDYDINLDGYIIAAGANNDLNSIIGNIRLYPLNTTHSANYIINGTLP